eukprot:PhF_6_TR40420/c0_g1_i2/m.60253
MLLPSPPPSTPPHQHHPHHPSTHLHKLFSNLDNRVTNVRSSWKQKMTLIEKLPSLQKGEGLTPRPPQHKGSVRRAPTDSIFLVDQPVLPNDDQFNAARHSFLLHNAIREKILFLRNNAEARKKFSHRCEDWIEGKQKEVQEKNAIIAATLAARAECVPPLCVWQFQKEERQAVLAARQQRILEHCRSVTNSRKERYEKVASRRKVSHEMLVIKMEAAAEKRAKGHEAMLLERQRLWIELMSTVIVFQRIMTPWHQQQQERERLQKNIFVWLMARHWRKRAHWLSVRKQNKLIPLHVRALIRRAMIRRQKKKQERLIRTTIIPFLKKITSLPIALLHTRKFLHAVRSVQLWFRYARKIQQRHESSSSTELRRDNRSRTVSNRFSLAYRGVGKNRRRSNSMDALTALGGGSESFVTQAVEML